MMKKMKKKFDCVEMMHRGALEIYKKTRNMTVEEEVAYWQGRAKELRKTRRQKAKAPA